jgi:hypothetical protein
MTRNRNTFAKRQREVEQKRKSDEKRDMRAQRRQKSADFFSSVGATVELSSAEHAVLGIFQRYLITTGQMFCFCAADLETYDLPLAQLVRRKYLVEEDFQGAYSLTSSGFAAMKVGA